MQQWSARALLWWSAMWALRLATLVAAGLAVRAYWLGSTGEAALFGGVGLVASWLQAWAKSLALGWFTDPNGERQKILNWNRGYPLYMATSRMQRIAEEAQIKDARRSYLFWAGLIWAGTGALAAYLQWGDLGHLRPIAQASSWVVAGAAMLILIPWLWSLTAELFYQVGWQDMPGAKVLDPEPGRPGLNSVIDQKAHGAGRIATVDEALAMLNPDGEA